MVLQQKTYTADEFWAMLSELPDNRRYELIEGNLLEMPPSSPENARIAVLIARLLGNFVEDNGMDGYVLGADGGYTLSPGTVRIPDVSYIVKSRYHPERIVGGPDLAVEVISPNETPNQIIQKVQQYLNAGTHMVWAVYPIDKEVQVYTPVADGMNIHTLSDEDTLTAGDVLPGFSVSLTRLFG